LENEWKMKLARVATCIEAGSKILAFGEAFDTYSVAAIRSTSLDSLRAGNRTVLFSTPNLAKGDVDWLEGLHTFGSC
jgi:hypothetical protein